MWSILSGQDVIGDGVDVTNRTAVIDALYPLYTPKGSMDVTFEIRVKSRIYQVSKYNADALYFANSSTYSFRARQQERSLCFLFCR